MLITFCRWFVSTSQKVFEVSVRIFVWNKSIWNCVTYIHPKCKSVCWLLSADDLFWLLRILVSSRENKVSEIVGQISLQYVDSRWNTKNRATNEEWELLMVMVKNTYFQCFKNPVFLQKLIDRKGRLPETKCTISRSDCGWGWS